MRFSLVMGLISVAFLARYAMISRRITRERDAMMYSDMAKDLQPWLRWRAWRERVVRSEFEVTENAYR